MRVFVVICLFWASVSYANIIGAGTEGFNPTTDQLDYVTVQSTKTLRAGFFQVGLFGNYASNTLPDIDTLVKNRARFADDRFVFEAGLGVGINDRWDAGLSVPTLLQQSVDAPDIYGDFSKKGRTEIRANTKYRIAGTERDGGLAVIGTVNLLQTEDDPFSGSGAGPIWNAEFAFDHTFGNVFSIAFNLGHRWRQAGERFANSPIDPLQNQFTGSLAASYFFESHSTKLIGELFGAVPSQSSGGNLARSSTSAEALLSLRHEFTERVGAQFGFSTKLADGITSPDFRGFAGLNISFGPLWGERRDLIQIPTNHDLYRMGTPVAAVTSQSALEQARSERARAEFKTPGSETDESYAIGYDLLFRPRSADLTDEGQSQLQPIVDRLKASFRQLMVEAHSDSMGYENDVADLSQERANSIKKYLVLQGAPEARIKAVGYGSSQPIASNASYQGRTMNRRITFDIDR